ncbi:MULTISPECIES: GNAT family N-acetyltransferase [unclassified Avibacterium]|uniref:GNAT family N-acetyltransferase n=1 Tax=unclassified Avibacterium TaxID=2685287 RepID=UPI0020269F9D|nr:MULTISPECIES: GNAT family N-acetyltransferase [unclassified Avibacterium]MCW9699082.1 GNAT family N-acetyltransferase [Avibacterium sp. 20-129]URL06723.1 GNAT family N-acetyltransferase [Avibacterium sp. 21-595]
MCFTIEPMKPEHYIQVYQLWKSIDGIDINPLDDSFESIKDFLRFNPDLNYIARENSQVIGVIMCGFDGRRATIYHMAVDKNQQGKGIGKALLTHLEQKLKHKNITKGRLLAFSHNIQGSKFWQQQGWIKQTHLDYFSKNLL